MGLACGWSLVILARELGDAKEVQDLLLAEPERDLFKRPETIAKTVIRH